MSKKTINIGIRVPVELNDRLDRLATSTGQTKSFFITRTLEEHLFGTAYIDALEQDAEAARRGKLKTRPLDELWDELGVERTGEGTDAL